MLPRSLMFVAAAFAVMCVDLPVASQTTTNEPKMQLPPDQVAYKSANQIDDPAQRIAALDAFIRGFPHSSRTGNARDVELTLLVHQQPQDLSRIHTLAKSIVGHADKESRGSAENGVAYTLAEAPPDGVDLKSAEKWARHAVEVDTLVSETEQIRKSSAGSKFPAPTEAETRTIWAESHANVLQTLADVYLHEGKLTEATETLDKAAALVPKNGYIFATRGQVLHAQHRDAEALEQLELADIYGGHTVVTRALLSDLYAAGHGGDRAGLAAELDARYRTDVRPFTPPPHVSPQARHTVLLELYTGSACFPCTGADRAFDSVLQGYPRTDVVALAFDSHRPGPDPLANPASLARGEYNIVGGVPTLRVDGDPLGIVAGRDTDARTRKYYDLITKQIDRSLQVPSGMELRLRADRTAEQTVAARAEVRVTDADALKAMLAPRPVKHLDPEDKAVVYLDMPSPATPLPEPKLVLNFALVQKEVTYMGENGVRFHSMVVRDLAKPLAEEFPVDMSGSTTATYTFDPAAISTSLGKYLTEFERSNDRFGTSEFLSKDTSLPLEELAVAAWVEDVARHQVVAAAYVLIGGAQTPGIQERAAR